MNNDLLKKANDYLADLDISSDIVIVGGWAFLYYDIVPRKTNDIDYINKIDDEVASIFSGLKISGRAKMFDATFGDWNSKIIDLKLWLSNLNVFTLPIEVLLASRLFNRKRYDDLEYAFKNKKIIINQNKFEDAVWDAHHYAFSIHEKEFLENEYIIIAGYKEKGWKYEGSKIWKLYKK